MALIWNVGEIAVFGFSIVSSGAGVTGKTTAFTIKRESDDYYWTGSAWQAGVTTVAGTEFDATNYPGFYTYELVATALTDDDILWVRFYEATTPDTQHNVYRFTKDDTERTKVTQDWGSVSDPTDYGGGDVVDGNANPEESVRVRAINSSNEIADETTTDANGQWSLFLIAGTAASQNIYTIEFYKSGFTKADAQVKVPVTP